MKKTPYITLLSIMLLATTSCNKQIEKINHQSSIYIVSDTHFLSDSLISESNEIYTKANLTSDGRVHEFDTELLDAFVKEVNENKPDYVFINLGTNDASAFSQPSVYHDVNGVLFDQRIEEDGSFEKASLQRFKHAVADFIKKVRKCNPDAYIIWGYGMLGLALRDAIVEVINSYKKESGDDRIEFMELTPSNEETVGSREHPGILCHKQAAKKIIERLNRLSSPHL